MNEVNQVLSALSLSQQNQLHYASMVDYYSITKLKRFDRVTQQIYLLCYLQHRAQINIERLADGFIYHVRKLREKAKTYAKETAYKDWEGAAANISKPAELLYFFIDETIDDQVSFRHIKQRVQGLRGAQEIESRLETFKTRYSSKYFGTNKGLTSMNLIANHVALNARIIGANEHESHFILDLLHNNSSEIKPDILSTDTHGVNHVNFALLDLFGYTFAPRYAQFGTVISDLFDVSEGADNKATLALKKPINTALIIDQWDTIQRIVISLQQKTITQATLVRKLSGYSQNHPLLKALTEYNRMLKAMYLLDYIDDASLRGYVQRALNRGEAYHQLRRAIAHVNGNRFRGKSDDEIVLWNECARLLTNAIIYFNSLILTRLLEHFEEEGDDKKLDIIKQVSPVAWHNINLNGTYSFSFEQKPLDLDEIMQSIVQNEN